MTTTTWQSLVAEAKAAVLAGNMDEARAKKDQAEALKALDALEMPAADPAVRLSFGTPEAEKPAETGNDIAVKSWYTRHYGDSATAMDQVMGELYGRDHRKFAWAKSADFIRYVRTGQYDPQMHRAVVFSPAQVEQYLQLGMSVGEMKATQIESQDTLGGFLVPEDFRDQIVQRLMGLTAMRPMAEVVTTTRDRVTMPVMTGGDDRYTGAVRVTKTDEAPTGTEAATNATFGQVTIPVHTIMGHVAVSKNLLEDSQGAISILPILQRQFAEAFAIFEDEQFIIGNGVGGPQGVLQDATTGGPYSYAYGSVNTQGSGNATALTGDAFRNLPYAIPTQYRAAGAAWLMSRGSVRVTKTLKDGSGAYLWGDRQFQLVAGAPRQLEGYDIRESEVLASPTASNGQAYTANVYPVLMVTKGAYMIVDRIGMDVTRYDDSTTGKSNQIVLVARRRLGGQVVNPWGIAAMKVSVS